MRLLRMIQHDWRDRLIACGLGIFATAGIGWFGWLRDQPVINHDHERRIAVLEKQLLALPDDVADAVVQKLKGHR